MSEAAFRMEQFHDYLTFERGLSARTAGKRPDEVIGVPEFDMLIVGEGEKPMVKLADTLAAAA